MITETAMTVIALVAGATKGRKKDIRVGGVVGVVKGTREREIKREGRKVQ